MRTLSNMIRTAHEIKSIAGGTPEEIKTAVACITSCSMSGGLEDTLLDIDGAEWRFINDNYIDAIQQDELASDEYILGCFYASFLAKYIDMSVKQIEEAQEAEQFELIGKLVVASGKIEEIQQGYVSGDGYGHHFAHYDHNQYELEAVCYRMFRVN